MVARRFTSGKSMASVLTLLFSALLLISCGGLPVDYFYKLIVVNRDSHEVEVYVDGERRGPTDEFVQPCTERLFDPSEYTPGVPLSIEVRDRQGTVLLATKAEPKPEGGYPRIILNLPASGKTECPDQLPVVGPTPFTLKP